MQIPDPPLALETRARRPIPNEVRKERPRVALDAAVAHWRTLRPNALLRSISNTYNCVGLVVACRRVWAWPEDLVRVLIEDGYRRLAGEVEVEFGDIVVYEDDDGEVTHVGIVIGKNVLTPGSSRDVLRVLSKWGGDGEYLHDLSHVPQVYGRVAAFWTDRRNV